MDWSIEPVQATLSMYRVKKRFQATELIPPVIRAKCDLALLTRNSEDPVRLLYGNHPNHAGSHMHAVTLYRMVMAMIIPFGARRHVRNSPSIGVVHTHAVRKVHLRHRPASSNVGCVYHHVVK